MEPTPITADLVRGALELERTGRGLLPHRLPARARAQCSDAMLANAESHRHIGERFAAAAFGPGCPFAVE